MKKSSRPEWGTATRGAAPRGRDEDVHRDLVDGLRRMEYREPPPELIREVMRGVRSFKRPWWRRLRHWATLPRSFVLTPIQLAPLALLLVAVSSLAVYQSFRLWELPRASLETGVATQHVKMVLSLPNIRSAAVIGNFNDWRPQGYEMTWSEEEGAWTVVLRLPGGRYEYAFVADDQIIPDPAAVIYQEDGFGNRNAVLMVGNVHETQI
ncbi:MAG: glycogen-binding domain-containing protein [Syntrophobacteraceae bacterium]|jgi:hypothetical protein|nr:glycogen-binding domain-containing protein [Syntrophobacteraceae bacterium]